MRILKELKNNKQKQNDLLDKLASKPRLMNFIFSTINICSRVTAPFLMLYDSVAPRHNRQSAFLHRIIRDELELKRKKYMDLMQGKADGYGFIEHETCDSLLFSGLVGSVGSKVVIEKARDEDGAWHRRDVDCPCYPDKSRSTISRDMLLGLLWYIWRNDRLDLAEDLWEYGSKNNWVMGKGDVSRIYFTPGLQATLAEIIYQLGGSNKRLARNLPQFWSKGLEGYRAHLQVLHILLRGELKGYITRSMNDALGDLCSRHPDNHLFTVAKGRFAHDQAAANFLITCAALGLEDIDMWPKDRLPSDADRSSRWIFENNDRSKGSDSTEIHTGGDFIFCASLILDYSDIIDY